MTWLVACDIVNLAAAMGTLSAIGIVCVQYFGFSGAIAVHHTQGFCWCAAATGYEPSADLALAYAVSRPLSLVRLPAEVLLAAAMSRLWPRLKDVHMNLLYERFMSNRCSSRACSQL